MLLFGYIRARRARVGKSPAFARRGFIGCARSEREVDAGGHLEGVLSEVQEFVFLGELQPLRGVIAGPTRFEVAEEVVRDRDVDTDTRGQTAQDLMAVMVVLVVLETI